MCALLSLYVIKCSNVFFFTPFQATFSALTLASCLGLLRRTWRFTSRRRGPRWTRPPIRRELHGWRDTSSSVPPWEPWSPDSWPWKSGPSQCSSALACSKLWVKCETRMGRGHVKARGRRTSVLTSIPTHMVRWIGKFACISTFFCTMCGI